MATLWMAADAADLMSRINRRFSKIVVSGVGMSVEPQCCSLLPNASHFWALSRLLLAPPPIYLLVQIGLAQR